MRAKKAVSDTMRLTKPGLARCEAALRAGMAEWAPYAIDVLTPIYEVTTPQASIRCDATVVVVVAAWWTHKRTCRRVVTLEVTADGRTWWRARRDEHDPATGLRTREGGESCGLRDGARTIYEASAMSPESGEPPWRIEAIPEKELRAFFTNMNVGTRIGVDRSESCRDAAERVGIQVHHEAADGSVRGARDGWIVVVRKPFGDRAHACEIWRVHGEEASEVAV